MNAKVNSLIGFGAGGAGGAVVPAEIIESGATGGAIADAQEGDVVVAMQGHLTNTPSLLLSGFTSIKLRTSTYNWSADPSYYVRGRLQYKILTGLETTIPSSTGGGNWVQFRADKPITSVSFTETSGQISTFAGSYAAVSEGAPKRACIRVVGTAGYQCQSTTQSLTTGDPQELAEANNYSEFLATDSFEAGSYSTTQGTFQSPSFFATLTCEE